MKSYVIVEGQVDAELVTRLFENSPTFDFKVLPANGRSSVLSLARTLLVSKQLPVLVMIDLDDADIDEVREVLESGLGQVAPARRWKYLVFDPDIETELRAFLPPAARRNAKTKSQRRALLDDVLRSSELRSKIRALPKLKEAVAFIDHWSRTDAGVEAAV